MSEEIEHISNKHGIFALSPLIFFIALYLVASIISGDFYKMPITIAFMLSGIYAIATYRSKSLKDRIDIFCTGAGARDIMLMVCIFVFAGAFANSAKETGCIDATVNFTLSILPDNMIMPALFFATCFISLSIGTSVGTIVALTPIAVGLACSTGSNAALMVAIIVGGSFFGDNLSFISDTTIVATSTQKCKQSDKFIVNSYTAIPAALVVMTAYFFLGMDVASAENMSSIEYDKIVPYLIVIITAICGLNVLAVLTCGIMATGAIGLIDGTYDIWGWIQSMGKGINDMGELIIVSVLAGGLLNILNENGALKYLIQIMTKRIHNKRSCEFTIAMLVSIVNVCTANNTVAILTVGSISKTLGDRYGVDNRKNASILDSFSCCIQGFLPYGAQLLIATGLSGIAVFNIIEYLYYPFALFAASVLGIFFRYPQKFS